MNSKFKELALKANLEYDVFLPDAWSGENKDLEKFAELIIKECAQCIDDEIGRLAEYHNSLNESETEERNNVELCMKKCYDNIELLKTHFGIEE